MSQYKNLEVCTEENKVCTLINAIEAATTPRKLKENTIEFVVVNEEVTRKWQKELQDLETRGNQLKHHCNTIYSSFHELMKDAENELTEYYTSNPPASYKISELCFVVGYNNQEPMGALCKISMLSSQNLGYEL